MFIKHFGARRQRNGTPPSKAAFAHVAKTPIIVCHKKFIRRTQTFFSLHPEIFSLTH